MNRAGQIKPDVWTHIAFVMNKGRKMRLYFDGQQDQALNFVGAGTALQSAVTGATR